MAAWALTASIILVSQAASGRAGVGLVSAYVVGLAVAYWVGAAINVLPWYSKLDADTVGLGFQESTYAVIAFGVGALLLAPTLQRLRKARPKPATIRLPEARVAYAYVAMGLFCFLVLRPLTATVPTVSALVSNGWNLLIVGLCLACWHAWQTGKSGAFLLWTATALSYPLITIVSLGFIGYGMAATVAILAFLGRFYRPRSTAFVAALVIGYVGLSLYVTYMRDRDFIRERVWGGGGLSARVERTYATLGNLEWFDPHNQQHLERIDLRLNQAYQVGAAVQYLDAGLARFAYSQTLWDGFVALIPRAIWPSKPVVAGSGDLVTRYTGLEFDASTSVGIGPVMEAYISFGTHGVVFWFLVLGACTGIFDRGAGWCLQHGDRRGFVLWFLPGLGLLQPGHGLESSLTEITASAGAALVVAIVANRLVDRFVVRQAAPRHARPRVRLSSWT